MISTVQWGGATSICDGIIFTMGESLLDVIFCSDISFCMSEPDDQPQSINIDLSNRSPLGNDILALHTGI